VRAMRAFERLRPGRNLTRATAMQLLHRVATIICIILTLAFGVWCLCASTIMSLPHVDARHGPLYR
jgi:hypothetical protein